MRHLIKGPHETMAQTKARVMEILASYEEDTFCYWGMEEKRSGTLVAVLAFGSQEMLLYKVSVAHNIDKAPRGIMQKVGMIQEGTVRAMIRNANGKYKDCAIDGLLRETYDLKKNE